MNKTISVEKVREKYQDLYEFSPDFMVIHDLEGKILDINDRIQSSLDYDKVELINRSLKEVVNTPNKEVISNYLREITKKGQPTKYFDCSFKKKDGNLVYINLYGIPLRESGIINGALCIGKDITQFKESEQRLQASKEEYRIIMETQTDLIAKIEKTGKYSYISPSYCTLLNKRKEDLIDFTFKPKVYPEDRDIVVKAIKELFQPPYQTNYEVRIKIKDEWKWYSWVDTALFDKNNKIESVLSVGRDISKLKETEGKLKESEIKLKDLIVTLEKKVEERTKELKESEEKYRNIVDNSRDALIIVGLDSNLFFVSPALSEMLGGIEIKSLKEAYKFIHPDDAKKIIELYLNAVKQKNIQAEEILEFRGIHKDGHFIWFSVSSKNYYDLHGKVIGFISILRDVTKSREAEQALKESEEKYRLITENANDLITVINTKFEMEFLNEKPLLNIAGYKKEELLGKNALDFMYPGDLNYAVKALQNWQADGTGIIEIRLKHKNGNYIWVEIKGQSFKDKHGKFKGILIGRDITEKKVIEKRLKESEEKYRLITESANDMIAVINQNLIFEYINEETCKKILGYGKEDLINKPALQFVHSDDLRKALSGLNEGFKKGEGMEEIKFKHKDNYYVWLQVRGRTFTDFDNKLKVLIIARDFSKQKEIELNLKSSEEKFRHLFERAAFSIVLLDINGKIFDCNASSEKIFLAKKSELIGKNFDDLRIIPLDELPLFKSSFEDVLDGDAFESLETQISRSDGSSIWINIKTSLFSARTEVFIQVIIQDITEKKLAEDKLRESVEKYRILIETAPISIVLMDFKGKILECNKGTESYTRLPRDQIIGKNIIEVYNLQINQEQFALEMFNITTSMEGTPLETEYVNKEGQKLYLMSYISLVKISNEDLIQVVSQDITERREAEMLAKQEYDKLKELDEIKKEFVYRASHELKTPLNSINVASAILLKYYQEVLNERVQKLLNIINSGGERLKKLVDDLVEITRIESRIMKLEKKRENIVEIINNMVNELALFAKERGLSLTASLEGNFLLEIDKTRFEQVLSNLIVNAIKNTPEGGKISIEVEQTPQFLNIKVIDTGVGVTAEEKEKLFKKFGKIERHGKGMDLNIEGSGLGLYISKEIVEMHGGRITVESEGKNKGATFIVSLPIFLDSYK